jgi:APA family basic amino acid/polyamine antiporter
LSTFAAAVLVVGGTVGVGIFLTPAGMARALGSPALVFAVWAFMGAAALCGALSLGELAARYPEAGGSYVYLREAYGPSVAFLYGWKCLLIMDPGLTAALATGLGAYAQATFPALAPKAVALAAIFAIAAANTIGLRLAGAIGEGLAIAKIALLVGLVVWGFASGAGDAAHFAPFFERRTDGPLVSALAGALVMAFFSFGGWWEAAKLAGEVREPRVALPRALALGVGTVTLLYAAVSAVFLYLVPLERAASAETFAAEAGAALFGGGGGRALSGLVAVFVASALFAFMTFAPRLYYAMARDGAAPRFAGHIDRRSGAPIAAIAVQALLAAALVLVGSFDTIVAYFVFVTVAFLLLTVAGLYRLPRPAPGGYQVPGWPVTPLAFAAMLAVMLALLAAGSPRQAALGTAVVLAGIPVYHLLVARRPARAKPLPLERA